MYIIHAYVEKNYGDASFKRETGEHDTVFLKRLLEEEIRDYSKKFGDVLTNVNTRSNLVSESRCGSCTSHRCAPPKSYRSARNGSACFPIERQFETAYTNPR